MSSDVVDAGQNGRDEPRSVAPGMTSQSTELYFYAPIEAASWLARPVSVLELWRTTTLPSRPTFRSSIKTSQNRSPEATAAVPARQTRQLSGIQIRAARQRLVLCRLMIDIMRSVHGAYAPPTEPFGSRLETFFIGLCIALGELEDKPFSTSKIAAFMGVPRTTVMRRLERLEHWGLVHRVGRRYRMDDTSLNSLLGMRSYQRIRRLLARAGQELTVLDTLPD
jgi:biotin operon repressor